MRKLVMVSMLVFAVGCGKESGDDAKAGDPGKGTSAAAVENAPAAAAGAARVDLKPLPLTIEVPPGGMGAMDMSMGDNKSVTVDIGGGASLNVSEEARSFADVKKTFQNDTILFPFKKWAKEEASTAIVQFENEGKVGFIGLSYKELGGKKYMCKTTGLAGVATAELAAQHLAFCDKIAAK